MKLGARDPMRWRLGCLLIVMLMLQDCAGHVRLTYPPSRKYHFDFLNNKGTPGPCGMPPGLDDSHTNLKAGDDLNIHWHLAQPHLGGHFFELRDANDTVKARYPQQGFLSGQNASSNNYTLSLPDAECDGCTLRMVLEARELGDVLFWTCATVNIKQALPDADRCSGHGRINHNGTCTCEKLYTGVKCQFKEECESDEDCGQHGMCVDTQATSFPKHQCYCSAGWFGPQCQNQSAVSSPPSNMSVYTSLTLSSASASDVTVHYRLVQDEVEVVMKARTASWMGFGWRPAHTNGSCKNFPDLGDDRYDKYKGHAQEQGVDEPNAAGGSKTEAGDDGSHRPTDKPGDEGQMKKGDGDRKEDGEMKKGDEEEDDEREADSKEDGEMNKGDGEADDEGQERKGDREGEGDDERRGEDAEKEGKKGANSPPMPALHPMDCTDLVIGSARRGYSRIGDYYTRDRSTPVHDEYLGGRNDLTAALVWEEGEHTFMLFRKKLTSDDPADHSLLDEQTHVLWAIGQKTNPPHYTHTPLLTAAMTANNVSFTNFYRQDELKYHGHMGQRGAATLNFYHGHPGKRPTTGRPSTDMSGKDKTPGGGRDTTPADTDGSKSCAWGSCPARRCGLDFSWAYNSVTDLITFNVTAYNVERDSWVSLGFSENMIMPDTDVVYGGLRQDGSPFVKDGWMSFYQSPQVDHSQDVTLVSGQHVNGTTTLVFSRKRSTGDSDDLDLTQCRYVFFAKGGKIWADNNISIHPRKPTVSAEKICFDGGSCRDTTTYITKMTVRLADAHFREALRDTHSEDFKQLASSLKTPLKDHFRSQLGSKFVAVVILAFRPGSIVVDFNVVTSSTGSAAEVQQEVETAANRLKNRTIGSYGALELQKVFDTYREEREPVRKSDEDDDGSLTEVEIIVIAVVLCSLFVAVLIGVCKFIDTRRRKEKRGTMTTNSSSTGSWDSGNKGSTAYGQFTGLSDTKQARALHEVDNPAYENGMFKKAP